MHRCAIPVASLIMLPAILQAPANAANRINNLERKLKTAKDEVCRPGRANPLLLGAIHIQ